MSAVLTPPVDYVGAARRHYADALALAASGSTANAGQLFGFTMECGLKALLVACGVATDADGSVLKTEKFRQHMPVLADRINLFGTLIPDGPKALNYLAKVPSLSNFSNWSVDHRYYRDTALPLASLPAWESAAKELSEMLDQAKTDGVL